MYSNGPADTNTAVSRKYGSTATNVRPRLRASRYIHTHANTASRYRSITTWAVSGLDIRCRPN
ncbi:hypothetical protein D3C76_1530730 [compost metagenome]